MYVVDLESSIAVLGTTFWRVPKILLALKNKDVIMTELLREKADVYIYGMTCYEILIGHIPFERKGNVSTSRSCIEWIEA